MWFVELANGVDGQVTDGNRVGRITMRGEITEFALPNREGSPINIAVGPDRNVWYTKGGVLGRVTPEGVITELPAGEGARAVGLSAGSDRRPPDRFSNRLWVAESAGNKIAFLNFK